MCTGEDADTPEVIIAELLSAWQHAFNNHRTTDIVALFTGDALFQGINPQLMIGPAEITEYYDSVADGATAKVQVLCGTELGEGTVGGFVDVTFTSAAGKVNPVRLSLVAQRVDNSWLIRQYHAALR